MITVPVIKSHSTIRIAQFRGDNDAQFLLIDQATSASVETVVQADAMLNSALKDTSVLAKIAILPGGTTADVPAGDIVIVGLGFDGKDLTENLTLLANQSTVETSVNAFLEIFTITFPAQDGAAATYDVGLDKSIFIRVPRHNMILKQLRVGFSSAPTTSADVTVNIDSDTNGVFDQVIKTVDGNTANGPNISLDDLIIPTSDEIRIDYANPDDRAWGVTLITEQLHSST